ncbi:hypothetical protein Asp14428_66430 [Actinoplanes sp. NBRC 14428]|nr:hypothetical protein Asp14428_66430 [Actinoplanes sp. NBRC 14428]
MTFGAVALFAALTWRLNRRWQVALGTVVLVMASYEGYSRMYTEKHWLTDVISGLMFGPILFLGYAVAVCVLAGRYPAPAAEKAQAVEKAPTVDKAPAVEKAAESAPAAEMAAP